MMRLMSAHMSQLCCCCVLASAASSTFLTFSAQSDQRNRKRLLVHPNFRSWPLDISKCSQVKCGVDVCRDDAVEIRIARRALRRARQRQRSAWGGRLCVKRWQRETNNVEKFYKCPSLVVAPVSAAASGPRSKRARSKPARVWLLSSRWSACLPAQ